MGCIMGRFPQVVLTMSKIFKGNVYRLAAKGSTETCPTPNCGGETRPHTVTRGKGYVKQDHTCHLCGANYSVKKRTASFIHHGAVYVVATSVLDKLEAMIGETIRPGRNSILGYPVDIEDSDSPHNLTLKAVDLDASKSLIKELRPRGFKVVYDKGSKSIFLSL